MNSPFNDSFLIDVPRDEMSDSGTFTSQMKELPRPFLPIALSLLVLRGSLLPWVIVRPFSGEEARYNLTDVRGGIGIIMTIVVFVLIGALLTFIKRITGMTIMSIAVAMLGWMAAISGILLGVLMSFIPSFEVAGLDLTRATASQGSGVVVTVIASLALAFLVVRNFEPLNKYSPSNRISLLPLVAMLPAILLATLMHAEWMRIGNSGEQIEAIIAGDSLYGSGLVVLVVWLVIGLWIGALVIQRTIAARIAGVVSIIVSLVVAMYATFLWLGGKALWWLLPQKAEDWVSISVEPTLFIVLMASLGLFVSGVLSFVGSAANKGIQVSDQRRLASRNFYTADLLGFFVFTGTIMSLVVQAAL
jgi:hypothetical protein